MILYLLASLIGAVIPSGPSERVDAPRDISIRLVPGPIHYDFLLPLTPETRTVFAGLADAGVPVARPEAAWVLVGWGSEAFYTSVGTYRDLSFSAIWRAAIGDASVLRVDVYGAFEPADWTREVRLSHALHLR